MRVLRPKLNNNFSRNDYDSIRDAQFKTSFNLSQLTNTTTTQTIRVGDFPLAANKLLDYNEYKVTQVQWVIIPKYVNTSTFGSFSDDPYLLFRNKVHVLSSGAALTYGDARRTPGFIKIPISKTSRTVINTVPYYEEETTSTAGTLVSKPLRKLGWIHNPDTSAYNPANHPILCPMEMIGPLLNSSFDCGYKIEVYATVLFRGYRDPDVVPDS